VDWLCSDVICYPSRRLALVERWRASGLVTNFVCTVNLQGDEGHDAARASTAASGSRGVHLHHNKHELCWMRLGDLVGG